LNEVIRSVVAEVSQYQVKGVRGDRTGCRLKRLEKKEKAMNMRVAEKQGAAIDSDNSSELSKILSFEMDGMCIDSISNSEGPTARVVVAAMF
jgi:hypothetical protein